MTFKRTGFPKLNKINSNEKEIKEEREKEKEDEKYLF